MATIIQRVSLLWRTFTPVECELLKLVREALPGDRRGFFDAQLKRINKAQRLLDWTEISFFPMRLGKPRWNNTIKFPGFPEHSEIRIAEIRFAISGIKFQATVWAVSGLIFQLTIRPSIKRLCFQSIDVISDVKLVCDFARPKDESAVGLTCLPESYREYLDGGRAMDVNDWRVLAAADAYRISLRSGDFIVLAAKQGGEAYLASREEDREGNIFLVTADEPIPRRQLQSFGQLLMEDGNCDRLSEPSRGPSGRA